MKIHENPETHEFKIKPESAEERALLKLILAMAHDYPRREMDQIMREYEKLKHCYHHFGLGHEVPCPHCKGIVNRNINYKCGLPLDHPGSHFYILQWDEHEGMNVWTPERDRQIITE